MNWISRNENCSMKVYLAEKLNRHLKTVLMSSVSLLKKKKGRPQQRPQPVLCLHLTNAAPQCRQTQQCHFFMCSSTATSPPGAQPSSASWRWPQSHHWHQGEGSCEPPYSPPGTTATCVFPAFIYQIIRS